MTKIEEGYRFGLIGWPVEHSKSPALFTAAYAGKYAYDLIGDPDFEHCWNTFIEGPYRSVNVTAPFKAPAAARADFPDEAVQRMGAANILVKSPEGIIAHNSDYLGVRELLKAYVGRMHSVKVIGYGGAGKAAEAAAESLGFETEVLRHHEIAGGAEADIIIFTLPRAAEGTDRLRAKVLIEANYRDPAFGPGGIPVPEGCTYVPGTSWHLAQAITGYALMTGEVPDVEAMKKVAGKG